MNIMDMFKPKDQAAAPAPVAEPTKQAEANPNNPAKSAEDPLDAYKKMFDNAATNSAIQAPSFSIDPSVLAEVSSKMDFTKGVSPELVQKATGGDAAAMMQLIQEVGKNSYRASLEHATKLTDTHLGQRAEYENSRLQKGVRQQLTSDALSANSNYNHPVIKAELNRIATSFANSPEYADASPQQIALAAKQYLDDVHSAMNPADPSKDKAGNTKTAEVDYLKYITG